MQNWVTSDRGIGRTAAGGLWAVMPMHITRAGQGALGPGAASLPVGSGAVATLCAP